MSISVLIPLYNCAEYLKTSLSSVVNQTYKDIEIVIIDNYSTDNPLEIINSFKDERIKYFKLEKSTLSNTLNYGLTKCTHEIVARMDADDIMIPQRLEKQINIFRESGSSLILSSWYSIFEKEKILYTVRSAKGHREIRKRLALHSEIIHSGVMYNKDFILSFGGYDPKIKIEDYELWLRVNNKAEFRNIPEVLTIVRYRPESISWSDLDTKKKSIYDYQEKYFSDEMLSNIGYKSRSEQQIIKGWREYFYGEKSKARTYWKNANSKLEIRRMLAALTTYFPEDKFVKFKESRAKFRLAYLLNYYSGESKTSRSAFKRLLKN